jgi:hypothetical protein
MFMLYQETTVKRINWKILKKYYCDNNVGELHTIIEESLLCYYRREITE